MISYLEKPDNERQYHYKHEVFLPDLLTKYDFDKFEEHEGTSKKTQLVDWTYHCIRRSAYYNYAIFEIFKSNKGNECFNMSQLKVVLDKILKIVVYKHVNAAEYYNILKDKENIDVIPLCKISHNDTYCKKLNDIINSMKMKYKTSVLSIGDFSPLEATVLVYLIELFKYRQYADITPDDIYNVINSFEINGDIKNLMEEAKNIKDNMHELMTTILETNRNITWNIQHNVKYDGNSNDIQIQNWFPIIGYNDTTVFHMVLHTDYSQLNHYTTMCQIFLERCLIKNAKGNNEDNNNKKRYTGKKIVTYLLILKQNDYMIYDDDLFEKEMDNEMVSVCKNAFIRCLKQHNNDLFNYCNFVKKDADKKWSLLYKSPYQYIENINEFKDLSYVKKFFRYLHDEHCRNNMNKVKKITDDTLLFNEEINKYIVEMCENYFDYKAPPMLDNFEW
jgi:hypothetical protein